MSDSSRLHGLQHTRLPCPHPPHPTTISWSLPQSMPTALVMPCSHFILCHPLLLPSVFPSIRVFSSESPVRIGHSKYWSFSVSPSHQHSQLISFKVDWFDLLVVQGTLKKLLQHHSSKASVNSLVLFMVQVSKLYVTTGKTIALTVRTFVSRVISLLFTTLSRFITTFLPRSNYFLISWLQSPSTVILEPKRIKYATVSTVSKETTFSEISLNTFHLQFRVCNGGSLEHMN